MSPGTRNGGPPAGTAAATSTYDATNVRHERSAPIVTATSVDKPCPGRDLWSSRVVDRLGHVHQHRGGPPTRDGHLREAPCGEVYRIVCGGSA